jgi:septin family protein
MSEESKLTIKNYDEPKKTKSKIKIDPNLPNVPFRMLLVGSSGSGKTTLLVNLFREEFYGKVFKKNHIIIFSPTARLDPKLEQIGAKNVYDCYNVDILKYIMDRQIAISEGKIDPETGKKKKGRKLDNILIIFDDCLGMNGVFDSHSMLNKMIIKARHYKISIIISTQKLSGVGRTIRLNMSAIFIFRALNGSEVDDIGRV